ncbi:hypothetical protein [Edaphobacter bradus]|uniref:hypothetical protein n=1 Tax=Edaphobacter bradus TaxID=2259016 RepID=UPI0021E0A0E3|nr:hypothetical protein [Edaphobacter bradus]
MLSKKLVLAQVMLLPALCLPNWARAQQNLALAANEANTTSVASSSSLDGAEGAMREGSYIRSAIAPTKKTFKIRPFRTYALGVRSDTRGPGIDIATPLLRVFNLRAGANFLNVGFGFSIDHVNYDSRLHLRSGQLNLDWFPTGRSFHISPGVLYGGNSLSAISSVPAGHYFELGSQGFINSVDDPMNGTARSDFPKKYAPMLTIGFGNLIPRSGRHFSVPIEIGAAYTGAAQINVILDGTACTSQGCFAFSQNPEAQASLKQEIQKLNNKLKVFPVYPILSTGISYRF